MTGCLWPCVTGGGAAAGSGGGLFGSKARGPTEVVRHARELLGFVAENRDDKRDAKRDQKMSDLSKCIREMKCILYGNGEAEPATEACAQLTREFFKENTNALRLLIVCLPFLDLETQKDVTQVIANLQRQRVDSRIVASYYLEVNQDLLDILVSGYILDSLHMKRFFYYIQFPDFNMASDAFKTFKELLTRHKSSTAEFFCKNYDWFFPEFNSKLLSSSNYIIRRQATQLLGDILLDKSNATVMVRYVSSKEHLIIIMNLLREQSKAIQVEAFRVFKLFTANKNKPPEIVGILVTNKNKILRFLADFTLDKEDNQFEADKVQVVTEVSSM